MRSGSSHAVRVSETYQCRALISAVVSDDSSYVIYEGGGEEEEEKVGHEKKEALHLHKDHRLLKVSLCF